mmetsp:Transcript_13267/g.17711  ORF Transcript_13267/g.17711 Transcript_13267/m.17711 type:complete len:1088 (+) Transcript_13267:68-3331(+)
MVQNNLETNLRWLDTEEGRGSMLLGMTPFHRPQLTKKSKSGFCLWVVDSAEGQTQKRKALNKLGSRGLEGLTSFKVTPQAPRVPLRELTEQPPAPVNSAPSLAIAPPVAQSSRPILTAVPSSTTITAPQARPQQPAANFDDDLYVEDWGEDILRECLEVTDEAERAITTAPLSTVPPLAPSRPLQPSSSIATPQAPLEISLADINRLTNERNAVSVEDLERLIASARTLATIPPINLQPPIQPSITGRQCNCGLEASRLTANTEANRGRIFFGCPEQSCDYFEWEDGQYQSTEAPTGRQCNCGKEAVRRTAHTEGNSGRVFFTCDDKTCDFFEWEEDSGYDMQDITSIPQTTNVVPANGVKNFQYENAVTFGHKGFRSGQRQVVEAALAGRDCFVLMPTGGGKSLCYQLPAWCCPGLAVVFSPLVSLIQDQVDSMNECGVMSATLSSSSAGGLFTDATWATLRSLPAHGGVKLLYITPEKLAQSNQTKRALHDLAGRGLLSRFIVDEAHCVSSWGHDFRPDYLQLKILRQEFTNVPIMALTATADRRVVDDVSTVLGLREPFSWRSSFNRAKLDYEVRTKVQSKVKVQGEIAEYVKRHLNESGLVYCLSRKDCETTCEALRKALPGNGHRISFYHGEVDSAEREDRQRRWSRGELKLMCATLAFGMGVNKPDVRYVIHMSIPKSLANYYQESGRCGRDGLGGKCILYFIPRDRATQEAMIRDDFGDGESGKRSRGGMRRDPQVINTELAALNQMGLYALDTVRCRRAIVLEYFGETDFDPVIGCGELCDNCRDRRPHESRDYGYHVMNLVQLVRLCTVDKKFNVTQRALADTYRGSENDVSKKLRAVAHNSSAIGRGNSLKKPELDDLILRLICTNILSERAIQNRSGFSSNYVFLGDAASNYLNTQDGRPPSFLVKVRLSEAEARRSTKAIYPPRPMTRQPAQSLSSEVSFSFDEQKQPPPPARRHSAPMANPTKHPNEFEAALPQKKAPSTCPNDQRNHQRNKKQKLATQKSGLTAADHQVALKGLFLEWREDVSAKQNLMPYQIISEGHMDSFAKSFATGPPRDVDALCQVVDAFPAVKAKKIW